MSRVKYFKIDNTNDDLYLEMDFGTYALMMYYASQVNYAKAEKLFNATLSEWKYRVEHNIDKGDFDSDNDTAHFVPQEITASITFINNEVIQELTNETNEDLIDKYGGQANFETFFCDNNSFLVALGVGDEVYDESKYALRGNFKALRDILQEAVNRNKPHKTLVV